MNGFEIRSDILKLAKDYMDKQFQANAVYIQELSKTNTNLALQLAEEAKKLYTVDEMLKIAEKMYSGFVTKK